MKATSWRTVWWHLRYPGLPAGAAPQKRAAKEYTRALSTPPGEEATAYMREALARRRVVTADEAAGLGLVDDTDLTENDIDQMMAAGTPVEIVTAPPQTWGVTPPDTPEEYYAITRPLTRVLGGDRSARIIAHTLGTHGHSLAAVEAMSDEELLAVPGIGETSLARIREHVPGTSSDCEWDGFTRCPHCRNCVLDLDIDQHLTACREAPVPVVGELLHCTCCCPESTHTGPGGHCVMPGCREEPCTPLNEWRAQQAAECEEDPVPVPGATFSALVEVARQVAASEPYPDPVPARNALAALYKARLIDRLGEED